MDSEVEEVEVLVVEEQVVVIVDVEEGPIVLDRTIPWLVTGAGCVVIWPATVLKPVMHHRREVALPALPVEVRSNPGDQAQKEVEEVDRSDSVASVSCTTTRVINTLSTMQDNCMCH